MCDVILYPTDETAVYYLKRIFMSKPVKELTPAIYEKKIFSSGPKNKRWSCCVQHQKDEKLTRIYNVRTKPLFCSLRFFRSYSSNAIFSGGQFSPNYVKTFPSLCNYIIFFTRFGGYFLSELGGARIATTNLRIATPVVLRYSFQ